LASEALTIRDIQGVGDKIAVKLEESGFSNLEALAVTPVRELVERSGLGEITAFEVSKKARVLLGLDFITAQELYEKRKNAMRITTAVKNLDGLLGGGVETQAMTELFGEYGTGKSQICMQLCVTVQLPAGKGGLGGRVLFFDTEGTFSPQRVYGIASAHGLDPEATLEKIIYARCYNSDHQILLLDSAFNMVEEKGIKLVIVDSLISHFRGEYIGRENLAERQQRLNLYIHKLLRLAEAYNCAVVVTNQIQANPQAFFGDPNRPAGGNVVAHASTHRLYVRKGKANTRVISVIDSPYLPASKMRFAITTNGVEDTEV
jgi:DNA repair protein RadA